MTYDTDLADRVRGILEGEPGVAERRMFGGLAFLVNGHLAVSASGQGGLLARVDPADTDSLLDEPHVRRFEMRGRQMDGWLHVETAAVASNDELRRFVARGVDYVRSLPPK